MTLRPCSLGTTSLLDASDRNRPAPTRSGRTSQITSDPPQRIDVAAVHQRLEVQVTPGGEPGGPRVRDQLTPCDVPARDGPRWVVVGGGELDAAHQPVVDDDAVAVPPGPAGADDRPGGGRVYRRPAGDAEVDAAVEPPDVQDRVVPQAEARGDRRGDRVGEEARRGARRGRAAGRASSGRVVPGPLRAGTRGEH